MPLVLAVCRGRCGQLLERRTLRNGVCSACRRPAPRPNPQLTLEELLTAAQAPDGGERRG